MLHVVLQALSWLRAKEKVYLPIFSTTTQTHRDFRDRVEFCMAEGKVGGASPHPPPIAFTHRLLPLRSPPPPHP